jgi:hypothetical protein
LHDFWLLAGCALSAPRAGVKAASGAAEENNRPGHVAEQ